VTTLAAETPRQTDVAVVGGGVMGSAAAWALARRGVGVVLLERFGPGHTRGASHGRARTCRSTYAQPHHQALVAEARRLWAELEAETGTVLREPATAERVDADAAVSALQAAAGARGAVVRHHRRVTAVEPAADGGVVVRSAAGASVRARAAVVAVGAWTADVLGALPAFTSDPDEGWPSGVHGGEFVLDRIGPVVVAAGFSGHGFEAAPAIGRVLADLALGAPAGAEVFGLSAAVLR
jgi:sarcosine oxidase